MNSVFVHDTAVIDAPCTIGSGTKIWHFSHVMKNAVIGQNCVLGQNVFVASGIRIGNRVKIQNNVSLYDGVEIESDVFLGPSCVFTNVKNPRAFLEKKNQFLQTLIKRGATIGANVTIVCGTVIGEFAFVGAGAVVTRDVPAFSLVLGNPGRHAGWVCRCGEPLLDFKSDSKVMCCCGQQYQKWVLPSGSEQVTELDNSGCCISD